MSDNDLIRRGDAIALFDAPNILEDLRAIPVADVQALVEALESIDALDPESLVIGCGLDALIGLVNLMGAKARAALAAFKGEQR